MENLNEFMLFFRMQPSTQQPTEAQIALMHQQWGTYIGGIAGQGKLISTNRLGFEGNVIHHNQSVTAGMVISEQQTLTGIMHIKAANMEEACELAKNCPVLELGGSVEVRSTLSM
jgi:hypothetical protein